jgi:hypothetical protein
MYALKMPRAYWTWLIALSSRVHCPVCPDSDSSCGACSLMLYVHGRHFCNQNIHLHMADYLRQGRIALYVTPMKHRNIKTLWVVPRYMSE